MLFALGYILTIFAANWAISRFGAVPVGFGLMAPAGVYFAGLAFTLRDLTQESLGRRWTVVAILAGAVLSAVVSPTFALASGTAFLFSELADFAVYTPLRAPLAWSRAGVQHCGTGGGFGVVPLAGLWIAGVSDGAGRWQGLDDAARNRVALTVAPGPHAARPYLHLVSRCQGKQVRSAGCYSRTVWSGRDIRETELSC